MINNSNESRLVCSTIENELSFSCADTSEEAWMQAFTEKINDLILNDFNRLVRVLYRLDINELKVRNLLKDQTTGDVTSAAEIIGNLIIERQRQKIKTRQEFLRDYDISEDEKW